MDQQRLTLFWKVLTKPGSSQDVIIRQWAVNEATSHSWVIRTSSILRENDLLDMISILSMGLSKVEWKKITKRNVYR